MPSLGIGSFPSFPKIRLSQPHLQYEKIEKVIGTRSAVVLPSMVFPHDLYLLSVGSRPTKVHNPLPEFLDLSPNLWSRHPMVAIPTADMRMKAGPPPPLLT